MVQTSKPPNPAHVHSNTALYHGVWLNLWAGYRFVLFKGCWHIKQRCKYLMLDCLSYYETYDFRFSYIKELMFFWQIRGSKLQNRIRYLGLLSNFLSSTSFYGFTFVYHVMSPRITNQIRLTCCHAWLCWLTMLSSVVHQSSRFMKTKCQRYF